MLRIDKQLLRIGTPSEIFGQVLDPDVPDGVLPSDVDNETEEREMAILQEEERSAGSVKLDVYSTYWKAVGLYVTPIILASLFLMQTSKNVWKAGQASRTRLSYTKAIHGGLDESW